MVKEMSQKLTAQMVCNNVVDAAKAPIYAYGIELLLSSLAGILALAAISLFLRVPFLWIPYLGGFIPIRLLGGGYHAKTHRSCITALRVKTLQGVIIGSVLDWMTESQTQTFILLQESLMPTIRIRSKCLSQ